MIFDSRRGNRWYVYATRADGELVDGKRVERLLTPNGGRYGSLSPSGDSLAYTSGDRIVIRDLSTGSETAITPGPPQFSLPDGFARWSPDGKWMLYSGGQGSDLHRVRVDGSDRRRLTFFASALNGDWSPDQRWIVYTSYDGVHRIRSDGSDDTLLYASF